MEEILHQMENPPLFTGFYTSQLVQNFSHQQYFKVESTWHQKMAPFCIFFPFPPETCHVALRLFWQRGLAVATRQLDKEAAERQVLRYRFVEQTIPGLLNGAALFTKTGYFRRVYDGEYTIECLGMWQTSFQTKRSAYLGPLSVDFPILKLGGVPVDKLVDFNYFKFVFPKTILSNHILKTQNPPGFSTNTTHISPPKSIHRFTVSIHPNIWMFPKIGVPPNHPFK